MGKSVKVYTKGLEQFRDRLQQLSEEQVQIFITSCAKELAARLLAKVIKRTPVGDYSGDEYITKSGYKRHRNYKTVSFQTKGGKTVSFKADVSGKKGGTLRRGWTAKTEAEAESGTGKGKDAVEYANSLPIRKVGSDYIIEIINPVHYASYVEFGHRTANHKGWVEGKFMLTISEQELEADAPRVIENKLIKYLGECFK